MSLISIDQTLEEKVETLRKEIIEVVSKNGGHLGASLGALELIVALHEVFDSPLDRLIFDTGHQTYAHKLLTGRKELFHTLRQYRGLCGFTNPEESEHDHFFAGHAGTALSLALGVHKSTKKSSNPTWTVAILGDASLSCGLTLEAFNNIQSEDKRLLIILNDNGMSISHGCGNFHQMLQNIQSIEDYRIAKNFFSLFHLQYIGPHDGHDTKLLIDVLRAVKDMNGPILLHVKTTKGYGCSFAENSPVLWHAPKPFCIESGKMKTEGASASSFPKVFGQHLIELKKLQADLAVVTPAMALGSCLEEYQTLYPDDFDDVGIAEGHSITYAGGLAKFRNKKVIVSIYGTFLQRGLDNLFHDVVLQNIPVVFAIDRAGISAQDGSTHHGIYDIAFLQAMPNLVIAQPRDGTMLKKLLNSAFAYDQPVAIRYPNQATTSLSKVEETWPLSQGEVIHNSLIGTEKVLLIPLGHMVETASKVLPLLHQQGYDATIFDPVFIKPLDIENLKKLIGSHDHIFIIEEHAAIGGLGTMILQTMFKELSTKKTVSHLAIPDRFISHGSYRELLVEIGLDADSIATKILKTISN